MNTRRDDIAAIKQLAAQWRAGWLAGDADALVSLYAQRPVLMAHGRPAIYGKAAIRSLYCAVVREVQIESRGVLQEVEAEGDWGYFWSTYSLRATPKAGGKPIRSKGKSVFIVRRQRDGTWKIARLIDNSDQ
ncbi:MAG TPA: SgcJ/EcaC family oxidoreductase [Candidatus Acidoferrum sp.]|nr:SgcJ/EcaC family oxidoreductase [Candidatus Acidoferrum sp.]